MSEIKKFLIYGREIPDKYVYEYLEKLVEQWSDSGEILLQYVQRINFAAIPVDFIEILNWLEDVDFSGEDDWDNFIFVASELYTSLYGEIEVKNKRNIGECYIIRVAGEALDCKKICPFSIFLVEQADCFSRQGKWIVLFMQKKQILKNWWLVTFC